MARPRRYEVCVKCGMNRAGLDDDGICSRCAKEELVSFASTTCVKCGMALVEDTGYSFCDNCTDEAYDPLPVENAPLDERLRDVYGSEMVHSIGIQREKVIKKPKRH